MTAGSGLWGGGGGRRRGFLVGDGDMSARSWDRRFRTPTFSPTSLSRPLSGCKLPAECMKLSFCPCVPLKTSPLLCPAALITGLGEIGRGGGILPDLPTPICSK